MGHMMKNEDRKIKGRNKKDSNKTVMVKLNDQFIKNIFEYK